MARTNEVTTTGGGGSSTFSFSVQSTPFNCTAAEAVNDAVYLFTANEVRKADATDLTTAPAIGIIVSKTSATECNVSTDGECSTFTGLTPGALYFLAKGSPGQITTTPITGPGIHQKLGEARNATTLMINVDSDFTELT